MRATTTATTRRAAPRASLRRRALLAVSMSAALALSGCAAAAEDSSRPSSRAPYAAVAEDGASAAADPTRTTAAEAASGSGEPETLDRERMQEVLLDEDAFPGGAEDIVQRTGVGYFEQTIGVTGDAYRSSFGDGACTRQMDSVNERLVGEDPVDGVFREATLVDDAAGGDEPEEPDEPVGRDEAVERRLYVWMLSYDEAPDTGSVWDEVLAACDGITLDGEEDAVSFSAVDQGPFRGISLSIDDGGSDADGFAVTADVGHGVVCLSSVGISREAFEQAVAVQRAALEEELGLAE